MQVDVHIVSFPWTNYHTRPIFRGDESARRLATPIALRVVIGRDWLLKSSPLVLEDQMADSIKIEMHTAVQWREREKERVCTNERERERKKD